MASKMLRIAGRDYDSGEAKAMRTDANGKLVLADGAKFTVNNDSTTYYVVDSLSLPDAVTVGIGAVAVAVNDGSDMQVFMSNGTVWKEL